MTIDDLRDEYAADQTKATEDFKNGLIENLTQLDCLRNSRWHQFMLDVARCEHGDGGLLHCDMRNGLLSAAEWKYASFRDSYLEGRSTKEEYASACVTLFRDFFTGIRDWGCITTVPTDEAISVYAMASVTMAEQSGVVPSDLDQLASLCQSQRTISAELVQWASESYGRKGCW